MSKINDSSESPSDEQKESLNFIRDMATEFFESFCQTPNSLTKLVRLFLISSSSQGTDSSRSRKSKDMNYYKQIMELFLSDPEINPNWSIDLYHHRARGRFIKTSHGRYSNIQLVTIINSYGSFEDLIYILTRPGFTYNIPNGIRFTDNLSTVQIEQLLNIFKSIGVYQSHFSEIHRDYFGFRIGRYDGGFYTDFITTYFHPPQNRNGLGPRCPCCAIKTNKNQLRFKGPANCHCRLHWDCALNLAVSFINQIINPNPLERKILSCPGCQGEIRPSFLLDIQQTFSSLETIIKYRKYLPENFIGLHEKELLSLIHLDLSDLNNRILVMNFQNHPNFMPCPKENCQGFALIDPDLETTNNCIICHRSSRFFGKNRQL